MELNERKKRILRAVVESFAEKGEPVGSKTIAEISNMSLSTATIRNELADLSGMGYLTQPHTSAGRIPSHLGYRYYVDYLMRKYTLSVDEKNSIDATMQIKLRELDKMISDTNKAISKLTNYIAVAISPDFGAANLKFLDLVAIDSRSYFILLVMENAVVKDRYCISSVEVKPEVLASIKVMLYKELLARPLVRYSIIKLYEKAPAYGADEFLCSEVLSQLEALVAEMESYNFYKEGVFNIFNYPEFMESSKAQSLASYLDRGDSITKALLPDDSGSVKITIGTENKDEELHDSSVVVANYRVGNIAGSIGVIGPTRMNYSQVVSKIEYCTKQLGEIIQKAFGMPDENKGGNISGGKEGSDYNAG